MESPTYLVVFTGRTLYNIGNGNPVKLLDFIEAIETSLGIKAKKNFMDMQPGDVYQTYAEIEDLFEATGQRAKTIVKESVADFLEWYKCIEPVTDSV